MQPEDIDKLFRDKLQQHVTPPPAHLWLDLQDQLAPAEKKRRGGFLLYAVAAAVTLLLAVGGGWLLWQPGRPGTGPLAPGTVAVQTPTATPQPAAKPVPTAPGPDLTPDAPASAETLVAAAEPTAPAPADRVAREASEIENTSLNSESAQRREATRMVTRTERPAAPEQTAPKAPLTPAPAPNALVAVQKTPVPPPASVLPASAPTERALAAADRPTGAVLVEVRETPDVATVAYHPTDGEPAPHRSRLLGIVKQVGRVARGEKPDLTEVGLPANPALTLQARVGNRTLTKTIEL